MPQGQRAFIAQPVSQMTRPRWQSANVRQMQGGYPGVGQVRTNNQRPRHPNMQRRGDAPYNSGVQQGRNMSNQGMRHAGPGGVPQQRAAYKLNQNTRNQYPAQQVITQPPPDQGQVLMGVMNIDVFIKFFILALRVLYMLSLIHI